MTRPRHFGGLRTDHGALSIQRHGFGQRSLDFLLVHHLGFGLGVLDQLGSSSARRFRLDDHFHVDVHWSEAKQKLASGSVFHYGGASVSLTKREEGETGGEEC